jgi:hypothetical protein
VGFEYRDGLGGVLDGCFALPEVPGDVLEGDVRRADLDQVTDLFPQPHCLFSRRKGFVHLVGDHAFGGEGVKQLGALCGRSRRGEPKCRAIVVHRFPMCPQISGSPTRLLAVPKRAVALVGGRRMIGQPRDVNATPLLKRAQDSSIHRGPPDRRDLRTDHRTRQLVPEPKLRSEDHQHALLYAIVNAVGVGTTRLDKNIRVEPQPQLRSNVQSAAAARRQPRRTREHNVAHRAG